MILLRHFFVALLPLVFGLGASWGFAFSQDKCGRLVGPIFAPKCHWIQLEYQLGFQMAGTLLRSEEHTSELQSLAYLVCRPLLEKNTRLGRRGPRTARPLHDRRRASLLR